MSTFEKPKERLTMQVNVNMSKSQIEVLDRIVKALGYRGRSDVVRAGLECLLEHNPEAAAAASQLSEGSEPSV